MADIVDESLQLLEAARDTGIMLRAIGGVAVRIHSQDAGRVPSLRREYGDMDFVTVSKHSPLLRGFFKSRGYAADRRFNALHGRRRMIFHHEREGWHIDILVDVFKMCHLIVFHEHRLIADPLTIPLAELLMTKLQVVELNEKDARDVAALLLEHPLGLGDDETINARRIVAMTRDNWGFFMTVRKNIDRLPPSCRRSASTPCDASSSQNDWVNWAFCWIHQGRH